MGINIVGGYQSIGPWVIYLIVLVNKATLFKNKNTSEFNTQCFLWLWLSWVVVFYDVRPVNNLLIANLGENKTWSVVYCALLTHKMLNFRAIVIIFLDIWANCLLFLCMIIYKFAEFHSVLHLYDFYDEILLLHCRRLFVCISRTIQVAQYSRFVVCHQNYIIRGEFSINKKWSDQFILPTINNTLYHSTNDLSTSPQTHW